MYSIYKWYFTKYLPLLRFATIQKPDQQNPTGMVQIKYTRKNYLRVYLEVWPLSPHRFLSGAATIWMTEAFLTHL